MPSASLPNSYVAVFRSYVKLAEAGPDHGLHCLRLVPTTKRVLPSASNPNSYEVSTTVGSPTRNDDDHGIQVALSLSLFVS